MGRPWRGGRGGQEAGPGSGPGPGPGRPAELPGGAPPALSARSLSQINAAARAGLGWGRQRGRRRQTVLSHPRGRGEASVPRSDPRSLQRRPPAKGWEGGKVTGCAQQNGLEEGVVSVAERRSIRMLGGMSAKTPQLPRTGKSRLPHGTISALLTPRIRRFPTQLHMTRK